MRLGGPAPAALDEQARGAGGARSALPPRLPALRGTALRPGSGAPGGGPYASSADAERGRPRGPRRMRRRHRVFVSRGWCVAASLSPRLMATRSRGVGGEICLKTPRPLPAHIPGTRVPVAPGFTVDRERSSWWNGDPRLLSPILELGGLGGNPRSVIERLQVPVCRLCSDDRFILLCSYQVRQVHLKKFA